VSRYTYLEAAEAMQAGVAYEAGKGSKSCTPKHLRVGVNSAMCDSSALARLLIEKGVITEDEYIDAITAEMNAEVERYEAKLSAELGRRVTLSPGAMHVGEEPGS
jgi:hypothetical protein